MYKKAPNAKITRKYIFTKNIGNLTPELAK
jgi:hypothetical protein